MSPPIRDGSGNSIGAIRLGDGSEISEVRTGAGDVLFSASTIPDSEADQKLVHRWYLGQTDPFIDQIGSANATNNGTTKTEGAWADGAARDGDGTASYIDLTTLGSYGSSINDGVAVAFSMQTTTTDTAGFLGSDAGSNDDAIMFSRINRDGNGDISFGGFPSDSNGEFFGFHEETEGWNDGKSHRVVINISDHTSSNGVDIYIDQSERSVRERVSTNTSFGDFTTSLSLFAGVFGQHLDGTINDVCLYNSTLTQAEIQSYNNPFS